MIRHLLTITAIIAILIVPSLVTASDFEEAQQEMLKASNADAWRILDGAAIENNDGPNSDLPPSFAPQSPSSGQPSQEVRSSDAPSDRVPMSVSVPQIPEPATMILVGMGLIGLGAGYRLRR